MTPIEKRLAEIRERLSKAVKGPWIRGGCSGRMITTPNGYLGDGFLADVDTSANSELIAHAPEDLKALLEAVTVAIEALEESCICSEDWGCRACEGGQKIHAILGEEK